MSRNMKITLGGTALGASMVLAAVLLQRNRTS